MNARQRAQASPAPAPAGAGPSARTRAPRPFRAIDGEGADIDGAHRYICMCADNGDTIVDPAGLDTGQCLAYIIRQARARPSAILIGFGLNYDVNMILRDVPRPQLEELWTSGETSWDDTARGISWGLEWIPGKLFCCYADTGEIRASAKVYDVFGFFQQSFVKALQSWGLGEHETISRMKERRGTFDPAEMAEITAYSVEECRLLVELMGRVRDALHAVELRPRSWLGAGAIASALLAKHQVDEHVPPPGTPAFDDVLLRAYFGGRTEVFRQGVHPTAASWDINSAYPHAALTLPTGRGRWRRVREYDPAAAWAIWRCNWQLPPGTILAPFPYRAKRAIFYPLTGEGYYHASEVAAALAVHGSAIEITSGYVFEPADDSLPFAFLAGVYQHRRQLKATGHPSEKVLKLGINSVYGKLAQGNSRDGRTPKFQSYFWAGAITAATRARVLLACAQQPRAVVAVATDGIVFAGAEPDLPRSGTLGGWERTGYRDFFVAQPGMYYAIERGTNSRVKHSRGFFTREINFPRLKRLWMARGPVASLPCASTRFVGLGSALMRKDFTVWRQWVESERRVGLYLSPRKFYEHETPEPVKQLHPPALVRAGLSDAYVPKHQAVELDPEAAEWVQGMEQPLRVL